MFTKYSPFPCVIFFHSSSAVPIPKILIILIYVGPTLDIKIEVSYPSNNPPLSSFPVSSRFHKVQWSYPAAFRFYELLAGYESDVSSLSGPEREVQMEENHHNYQFRSASSNRWVYNITAASCGSLASHRPSVRAYKEWKMTLRSDTKQCSQVLSLIPHYTPLMLEAFLGSFL